jgi:hypothetical protein
VAFFTTFETQSFNTFVLAFFTCMLLELFDSVRLNFIESYTPILKVDNLITIYCLTPITHKRGRLNPDLTTTTSITNEDFW